MAFKDLSDHLLLKECQQNNLQAYDVLFYRYSSKLYTFSLRYLKDETVAEELVMDVLFYLWQKRQEIDIQGELSSYLFRAIRNAIINHFRKKVIVAVGIYVLTEEATLEVRSADYYLSCQELEKAYQEKLEKLSPQRRRVFELSREENKSYAEIATEMNLSVNTVENYMVATLKFFRKHLQEYTSNPLLLIFLICPAISRYL